MERAVGFARVSSGRQARNGISLEDQQVAIAGKAAAEGLELAEIIVAPGETADLKQPGIRRLIGMVKRREVSAVIFYALDRLVRGVRNQEELLEIFDAAGVTPICVVFPVDRETPEGLFMVNVHGSANQYWRDKIRYLTKRALARKKAKGERTGTVPFGYQVGANGVHLEKHTGERRLLSLIRRWRNRGKTLRGIRDELNRRGYVTRRGNPWSLTCVVNLLRK